MFAGEREVEGVRGVLVGIDAVPDGIAAFIPVVVDPDARFLARGGTEVVVDARMPKGGYAPRNGRDAFVVGLGPGFTAGLEVDAVVETQRGPDLGRVIWTGTAEPDTSLPSPVLGFTEKRVLRAPRTGTFHGRVAIGAVVIPGDVIGEIDGEVVTTPIAGLLRGVLKDGVHVPAGTKIGDVDPRGPGVNAALISDKARAVAAGVLEAILVVAKDRSVRRGRRAKSLPLPARVRYRLIRGMIESAVLVRAPRAARRARRLCRGRPVAAAVDPRPTGRRPRPPLETEHASPSGAFTFRTPEGWKVETSRGPRDGERLRRRRAGALRLPAGGARVRQPPRRVHARAPGASHRDIARHQVRV